MTKYGSVKITPENMTPKQQMVHQMWLNGQQIPEVYVPVLRNVVNLPPGVKNHADWRNWNTINKSLNQIYKTVYSFNRLPEQRKASKEFFGLFEGID